MFFVRFWRETLICILAAVCYYIYNISPQSCPTPSTIAAQETQQKEEKIQTVTTTTKKPDGTVVKKVVTTEKKTKVEEKSSDKQTVPPVLGAASLTRYDVHVSRPFSFDSESTDYQVGVGARIGNLPVFGTIDYRYKTRELFMGARVEW